MGLNKYVSWAIADIDTYNLHFYNPVDKLRLLKWEL